MLLSLTLHSPSCLPPSHSGLQIIDPAHSGTIPFGCDLLHGGVKQASVSGRLRLVRDTPECAGGGAVSPESSPQQAAAGAETRSLVRTVSRMRRRSSAGSIPKFGRETVALNSNPLANTLQA